MTIKLTGHNASLDAVRADLERLSTPEWFRPADVDVSDLAGILGNRLAPTVLQYRGSKWPAARVLLSWRDGQADVDNIVPAPGATDGRFSPLEFEGLGDDLYSVLKTVAWSHLVSTTRGADA
jgi:hypothetical protein